MIDLFTRAPLGVRVTVVRFVIRFAEPVAVPAIRLADPVTVLEPETIVPFGVRVTVVRFEIPFTAPEVFDSGTPTMRFADPVTLPERGSM